MTIFSIRMRIFDEYRYLNKNLLNTMTIAQCMALHEKNESIFVNNLRNKKIEFFFANWSIMLTWLGIKSRESFNGRSRLHISWDLEEEKYGLRRTNWYVYQSLLLFYMANPFSLLIPELITEILRRSFWIAIKDRIKEARSYGWEISRCYNTTINAKKVADGLIFPRRGNRKENDDTEPKRIEDARIVERNSFIVTDIDGGEQIHVADAFLNDD